ncbi:hypothetical protein QTP70_033908 [Hemibagrus guttatus]|uniref:ribonuclease H n=1 Tax=Hemibagrus guttatus TaxID=175788 RepID=A0AAE0QDZ8_9TELE|nr:hypothetical protein QTP70_033908 [Hemibagrus guttatus]
MSHHFLLSPYHRNDPESVAVNEFQEKFKLNLMKRFQFLHGVIINPGNQTLLSEIYTELYITEGDCGEVNNEHEVRQIEAASRRTATEETPIKCNDIFKPFSEQDEPIRTVLTKGVAGIGKTVSVHKFILDWAEGKANQDIHLIFPLPCRELNLMKDQKLSLMELLHFCFNETKETEISSLGKVLLIFDGLDESCFSLDFQNTVRVSDVTESASVPVLLINLIKGNLLPSALIWITSRPAAADQIPSECVHRVTEVRGFSDPQKEEYFRKRISDQSLANSIITHLKSLRILYIMCHIPVFCWISATVLERMLGEPESGEIPKTLTQMYTHFLIIQTNIIRDKYSKKLESVVQMLLKLGKLAFQQLKKGNLIFYEEDLRECGIDEREVAVYSGVCTQIFKEESGLHQSKVYCFVHLSVQEHLAALYLHLTFMIKKINVLKENQVSEQEIKENTISDVHKSAVDLALKSQTGQLDIFLRFLLGFSLESNQKLLHVLVTQTGCNSTSTEETVQYIKKKISKDIPTEKSINLFHCLNELGDNSLVEEIQHYLKSEKQSELSSSQWSALVFVLLTSAHELEEFDVSKYTSTDKITETVLLKVMPVIAASRKAMKGIRRKTLPNLTMQIVSTNFIPDWSRPGLTTTAIGAVDLQGAGGNWATVGRRCRGGRRVHRQREKRKGKGRELADMMERRKVDILCVKETRWKGSKARSIGAGFKLFYYGVDSKRNGVGVVLKEEFVRNVLEVGCELEEKERFWSELDEVMESIPMGERVVILMGADGRGADFNGHVGEGNRGDEEVMGKFGVKEGNLEGQMVVDFAKRMDMAVVNTYFQKREEHRVTYKSGGRRTQKLRQALGGQVVLPDDWETTAEVIRETGRKVLGVSTGRRKEDKETWCWNEEVQDSIQRKRLAKKKWDMDRTEENRQEYKELQRRVKREVSKAKQKAYDELYTRLDTREGEKDLYRLARERDRDGKDVQQVRVIKDRDGSVLTSEESVQRRWKEYFEKLIEENEREKRVEGVNSVEQKVDKIRKDEVRKALKRMKSGKAVGPDDIPVEVWKCLEEAAMEFLTSLFNRVLERVAEKYVRVVQDMYERSRTVVRCAVGQTEEFKVEMGLHQGSPLSPFLFAIVMDQLSEEVRQESPWTMMFADDIVICSESREQVEENLERWRFALERRGMKVSRSKTEYMCVNEREGSGTVRLQGEEVKKVQEFKYLGSTVQSNGECGKEVKKLCDCGISDKGCASLTSALRSNPSHLRELKVAYNNLGDSGVKRLSAVLENLHCNLEKLSLRDCGVSDEGCAALTSALTSNISHLRDLNLSCNNVGDSGLKCLSSVLENPHCKLETLRLRKCALSDEGCAALTSALRSNPSYLRELNLSYNNIGDSGVKCLSAFLENPYCKLETLWLCDCGVSDEGCAALTSALRSNPSHLRDLNLSINKLGDSGVKCLSAVLENPHCKLEKLWLWDCGVSDEGCAALTSL